MNQGWGSSQVTFTRHMKKELKHAQQTLTEDKIRRFWRAISLSFPELCVTDGLKVNYNKDVTAKELHHMCAQLTRCKSLCVATPLFHYHYDPPNETPHHVTAITLTKLPHRYHLSLFDPKGRGSVRKSEEKLLMKKLAECIHEMAKVPVSIHIYEHTNLQLRDDIGLCQLFSLYYLYEYFKEVSEWTRTKKQLAKSYHLVNPRQMVEFIKKKRGGFDENNLLAFWTTLMKRE